MREAQPYRRNAKPLLAPLFSRARQMIRGSGTESRKDTAAERGGVDKSTGEVPFE